MNRLVSRNILVILQLIVSAGSFYNSLYWILFLVGFSVSETGMATLAGGSFFLPLFIFAFFMVFSLPVFVALIAFLEAGLGYVGMRLSYNFWKLKAGNQIYILVFQIIIIISSCLYFFYFFDLFINKRTPTNLSVYTEKYSPSPYLKIANVIRMLSSIIILRINHFNR